MVLTDEKLKKVVIDQLFWDSNVDSSLIRVVVSDGKITLCGSVPTDRERVAAENATSSVRGVRRLKNKLEVRTYPNYGKPPTDDEIHQKAKDLLALNPWVSGRDIEVTVEGGHVTLAGTVGESWKKWKAENLMHNLHGVTYVTNHLAVVLTESKVDKEIAKYIEAALDHDAYMFAEDVDVQVENGTVSLTGQVPSWYARWRAYDIAKATPGVIHVSQELESA
ncbi:MAG: BON domain-containing protein [Anaerolineales bacterium]